MNKIPLLLTLLSFVIYRLTLYLTGELWLSLLIFLVPISLLLISFILRKRLAYSKWFLSSINIFCERKSHVITSDISMDLLYEKLHEVVQDTEFKLLDSDKLSSRLLMGTSLNFWTWGENIYILLEPSSNETVIHFTSVTLFGNTSWNRNDKNFVSFIDSFESSLII